MQHQRATRNSKAVQRPAQLLNALRLRVFQAKAGFMTYGTDAYMPFIDAQATREGIELSAEEKQELRQLMNGRVSLDDVDRIEFIERALEALKAA